MRKLTPVLLFVFLLFGCGKKPGDDRTGGMIFKMDESSPEYHAMAVDHMKKYVDQNSTLVDTIKIEGNKLFIKFRNADPAFPFAEFAKTAGVEFNSFKLKKLRYGGVSVYCITDSGIVAHAMVQ